MFQVYRKINAAIIYAFRGNFFIFSFCWVIFCFFTINIYCFCNKWNILKDKNSNSPHYALSSTSRKQVLLRSSLVHITEFWAIYHVTPNNNVPKSSDKRASLTGWTGIIISKTHALQVTKYFHEHDLIWSS